VCIAHIAFFSHKRSQRVIANFFAIKIDLPQSRASVFLLRRNIEHLRG
jgi:hypothetical protein